jgi:acetylornithine deacetylase/succinyl-diaminopimelate desuccinylase-like protein
MPAPLDPATLVSTVEGAWEEALVTLCRYTEIDCLSPAFDASWREHHKIADAATLLADWVSARAIPGLAVQIVEIPDRTPALLVEIPASQPGPDAGAVLIYGHLDKQPPLGEWRSGLAPFQPVREGDRLYGRGTADDGYSTFAALLAVEALAGLGVPYGRIVVLIEASEESGSPDLAAHLDALEPRIGRPKLVVCLDSGCHTYDRLWLTTSLRGLAQVKLSVSVLTEGIHSGNSGAGVPSSFRVLRELLSRIEDETTGDIVLAELRAPIPELHREIAQKVAQEFPHAVRAELPITEGLELAGSSEADRLLGRAWRPTLCVTGIGGIPGSSDAGNVLRASTTAVLSVRLPPSLDAGRAERALYEALTADPPQGASVHVEVQASQGWAGGELPDWLDDALSEASVGAFGRNYSCIGEGGTIPFLAALDARFPGVPFVATGVLGPQSNAHGPNEFLHIPMVKSLTAAVASLLADTRIHDVAEGGPQ